jgi:hypothetical protein
MIDLGLVKQHLNIIDNHDDMYILQLIQIAEHTLETELNINLCDIDLEHEDIVKNVCSSTCCSTVSVQRGCFSELYQNDLRI